MYYLFMYSSNRMVLSSLYHFSAIAHKTRILDVVYNASNNELVRTKTLVKNCIIQIDATPFRQWYVAFVRSVCNSWHCFLSNFLIRNCVIADVR